jgi:hypothetical protein
MEKQENWKWLLSMSYFAQYAELQIQPSNLTGNSHASDVKPMSDLTHEIIRFQQSC